MDYFMSPVDGVIVRFQRFYCRNADIIEPLMDIAIKIFPSQLRFFILFVMIIFELCELMRAMHRRGFTNVNYPPLASKTYATRSRRNRRFRSAQVLLMNADEVNILTIS